MTVKQLVMCLVLLWPHASPLGTEDSSCELSEDETGCVCSTKVLGSPLDLLMCLSVQELELRNGCLFIDQVINLSLEYLRMLQVSQLVFRNVSVSPEFLYELINVLPLSKVNSISILGSTLEGLNIFNQTDVSKVKMLRLDGVTIPPSLLQHNFRPLHSWLLEPLTSFSLKNSHLSSQQTLCDLLILASDLQDLDLSWNNFSGSTNPAQCFQDGKGPKKLNLSHSALTDSGHLLPTTVEVLDLSANALEQFPFLENQTRLQDLRVDGNRLRSLLTGTGTGASLGVLGRLQSLYAGENPYHCDCSLKETLDFLKNTRSGVVKDWPQGFVCHTPLSLRGTLLSNISFSGTCNGQLDDSSIDVSPGMSNASPLSVGWHVGSLSLLIWLLPTLL